MSHQPLSPDTVEALIEELRTSPHVHAVYSHAIAAKLDERTTLTAMVRVLHEHNQALESMLQRYVNTAGGQPALIPKIDLPTS